MRALEAAWFESVSTRAGVPHAPPTKRETNGWTTPPSLFRYTSAAELSGATSMSGLALSIRFDGPSTATPGKIAADAGTAPPRAAVRASTAVSFLFMPLRTGASQGDLGVLRASLAQGGVQRLVHELVRASVLLAAHRADGPLVEAP